MQENILNQKNLIEKIEQQSLFRGFFLFGILNLLWIATLQLAPTDSFQGDVYKIIYIHVPHAFISFLMAFLLLIFSLIAMIKKNETSLYLSKTAVELGCIATVITLLTGMIWGKPTWGVWWTWDARLTTTLLLGLLYGAYLIAYEQIENVGARLKVLPALGIIIFINVPIVYKSVTWWRTLHQPPTLLRPEGGSTIDPEMKLFLLMNFGMLLLYFSWLFFWRWQNVRAQAEIEKAMVME